LEGQVISSSNKRPALSRETAAVWSLIVARVVYAINTLSVSAIFFLVGRDIDVGVDGLALLTSAFYLGTGAFQVPAGILIVKWGPKRVASLGVVTSSLAVILTSISASLLQLSILRLIVGAGMALVFAPSIVLLARLLGEDRSGSGIGLYNSANGIGGLIGLFGWILLASTIGWRLSLALGGVLGLLTAFLLTQLLPNDKSDSKSIIVPSELGRILKDKGFILLGFGTLGLSLGYALESNFMTYYLHQSLGEIPAVAGLIAWLLSFQSSPLCGAENHMTRRSGLGF